MAFISYRNRGISAIVHCARERVLRREAPAQSKTPKEALVKRLSTGVLAALIAVSCGLNAVAAPSSAQTSGNTGNSVAQTGTTPAANFGTPPSGQIPILYNDHHVYS